MDKKILLSFDVEEFDIPEEYGHYLDEEEKLRVGREGLLKIIPLLEKLHIRCTLFTTAFFAEHNKSLMQSLSRQHEIASHGYHHDRFEPNDLTLSKHVIESIIKKPVTGFRMARLQSVSDKDIADAGYLYNSSMNPTFLPGRYNNFLRPRTPYKKKNILNIPVSVTPYIRFPLFWLSFKNVPFAAIKAASKITLASDTYLALYYHPWEATDLSRYNIPFYTKHPDGDRWLQKLEQYLLWLKKRAEFITYHEFAESFREKED